MPCEILNFVSRNIQNIVSMKINKGISFSRGKILHTKFILSENLCSRQIIGWDLKKNKEFIDMERPLTYNSSHIISFIAFAMIEPARPEQRQAARLPTIDREPGDKELFKYRPGAVCGPRYSHIV